VPKVYARDNEPFQVLMRRFKKSCEKAGLLSDIKKNNYYQKPSVVRRKQVKDAKRKQLKLQRKMRRMNRAF